MATSGKHITTIKSKQGPADYGIYLVFKWERTSYSIENNTSNIYWVLQLEYDYAKNSNNFPIEGISKVNIDGNQYELSFLNDDVDYYKDSTVKVFHEGNTTIPHSIDGSKSFSFSYTLDYSYFTLLAPYRTAVKSGSDTAALDAIPQIKLRTVPSTFTDEETLTITYYNDAGDSLRTLQACLTFDGTKDDIAYRDVPKTNTLYYTFNFTSAEKTLLRNNIKTGTSTTIGVYLRAITATGELIESKRWITYSIANGLPALNPIVYDTHQKALELTGASGNYFIKGISRAFFNTRAQAQKGATIEYQRIICGSTTLDDYTSNTGYIDNVDSNTFYFLVQDNRGNVTRDAVVVELIPYFKPTVSIQSAKLNGNGELTFTITGKYYSGKFNETPNTMELEYMVQDEDGAFPTNALESGWVRVGDIEPNIDGDNYTYTYTITGLNYEKQQALSVNIIDEITSAQSEAIVLSAQPIFDWSKKDFRFHTDVVIDEGKKLIVGNSGLGDMVIEQGNSGNWYYRKWQSGKVELFGYRNVVDEPCTIALGNWYRTIVLGSPMFPFPVKNPIAHINYETDGFGALVWVTKPADSETAGAFYLIRPTSSTGITGRVTYQVIGEY